jgi:hypothetical protein
MCAEKIQAAAVKCKHCGASVPPPEKKRTKTITYVVAGVVLLFIFWRIANHAENRGRTPTAASAAAVASSAPWKGPASWTETLQKLLKHPNALKATGKTRDDDVVLTTYDFGSFQAGTNGTLARVDGKSRAWRWEFAAQGILPTDIAAPDQVEQLFETKANVTWCRIKGGPFENVYVGFKPSYLPSQALLTIETPEYSEATNETGLQPWLCANGRVPGVHSMETEALIANCQELVTKNLRAPSTAKFQGLLDGMDSPTFYASCNMEWKSWVESKNALGVPLRTAFVCTYDGRNQQVRLRFKE